MDSKNILKSFFSRKIIKTVIAIIIFTTLMIFSLVKCIKFHAEDNVFFTIIFVVLTGVSLFLDLHLFFTLDRRIKERKHGLRKIQYMLNRAILFFTCRYEFPKDRLIAVINSYDLSLQQREIAETIIESLSYLKSINNIKVTYVKDKFILSYIAGLFSYSSEFPVNIGRNEILDFMIDTIIYENSKVNHLPEGILNDFKRIIIEDE